MRSFDDFIRDGSDLKRSAQTKFDLLICGVRDNENLFKRYDAMFKEEHYAFDNGNWGVDKKRLTPTELILPGGIVSKIHIRPDSPLHLEEYENALVIFNGNEELSEFRFLPKPNFWKHKLSNGENPKRYAQMYGLNCLNFSLYSGCEFQDCGKGCLFCSVSSTVDADNPIVVKKGADELAEVCQLATDHDDLEYIIITGGSYIVGDKEFENHIRVIQAIRDHLPWNGRIKGNVSLMPPKNSNLLVELYKYGVDNPSFNIEVWPQEAFERVCPGKAQFVGFKNILKDLDLLVSYYGAGKVWSNFVAGIVPIEDMLNGFKYMAEHGVIPGANIYHAEVDSKIGRSQGADYDYIKRLYSFLAELYDKYSFKPFFNKSILRNSLANEFYEGLL